MTSGLTIALLFSEMLMSAEARRLLLRGNIDPTEFSAPYLMSADARQIEVGGAVDSEPHPKAGHSGAPLATSPERKLGFPHPYNINPERAPTKNIYVGCIHDIQTHQRRHYHEHVPKEDREKMTVDVCMEFCKKVNGTQFFGLHTGNQCYCTPFFHDDALVSKDCDKPCEGDHSSMCGGADMVSMWSVFDPENAPSEAEDPGECGGAGVQHQTCRSRAYADRDCRYVYKDDIDKCGVQKWGCYPMSSLPQECKEYSTDQIEASGGEEDATTTTTTTTKEGPNEDPGACGGAGVKHQTCRSQAYADRDCRYVCNDDIGKCGVQKWGCYPTSSLPQECKEDSADER